MGVNFGYNSKNNNWSEEDKLFLINNFYEGEKQFLIDNLNKNWEAIRSYATKYLRLTRKRSKYKLIDNKRICKCCGKILDENTNNFYKDKNGFRLYCIECWKNQNEIISRNNGIITRKLRKEILLNGFAYCGKCKQWLPTTEFYKNFNNINNIHRWCINCCKDNYYLRTYNTINLNEIPSLLFDSNHHKCDSLAEVKISNWLIENNIVFESHGFYKDYINEDNTKRRFDWVLYIDNQIFFVEYFGLYKSSNHTKITNHYTFNALKKIKDLKKYGVYDHCIIIYPDDLKNKSLEEIFGIYTQTHRESVTSKRL